MLQAETLFRWKLRLFGIGILVMIGLGVVEANFGDPPLLHALVGGYILFGMILIPAVVLSGYVVVVFGLAIVPRIQRPASTPRSGSQRH
jgi:hypothetical protein